MLGVSLEKYQNEMAEEMKLCTNCLTIFCKAKMCLRDEKIQKVV